MISGEVILCFSLNNWFSIWRNRQHIMSRLAIKNRILYVNPGCTVIRAIILLVTLKFKMRHHIVQDNGVYIFSPPTWLVRFPRVREIDRWLKIYRNRLILGEMKKMGFKNPILWIARPDEAEYIDYFRPKLVCYHVVDEYAAYMGLTPAQVKALEEDTARKADIVITVSRTLYERKKAWNKHTYVVPNGVDYEGFSRVKDEHGGIPVDISGIGSPIIGYIGAINPTLDLNLIAFLAEARPAWNIVIVGPIHLRMLWDDFYRKLRRLKKLSNVHFLGEKSREEVVRYFKAIDVGIMSYKLDLQVINSFPLKMFEFLACGKPVVSVDVPSVREYHNVVKIAKTSDEFLRLINDSLDDKDPQKIIERKRVAQQNTWEQRVALISELIQQTLQKKYGSQKAK